MMSEVTVVAGSSTTDLDERNYSDLEQIQFEVDEERKRFLGMLFTVYFVVTSLVA